MPSGLIAVAMNFLVLAEDALADLVIAMESLFLSDAGEAKERGELRYRLAQRLAFFLRTVRTPAESFLAS